MRNFDRRGFLTGTAGAAGLVMLGGLGAPARAAGPLTVGVLIPGSKSDKGWMESGYDGLKAAREEARRQDRRQVHREREVRRHGAGAGDAGRQERSGDRRRRPDPGVGLQGGAALPQGEIRHHRRQCRSQEARQCLGLRRASGRDRLRRRRGGRHAVQDRRRVLCRRPRDPGHQERRHRVRQRRAIHQSQDQVFRKLYRRLRRRRQGQGGDPGRHRPGRRHPLPHPQSRPARHGTGGAREGYAHHRRLYRSLRHRSALRRLLGHRRRLPGRVRHGSGRGRHLEAGVQAVRPGDGPASFRHDHLQGDARAEGQARGDQEGSAGEEDQGSQR